MNSQRHRLDKRLWTLILIALLVPTLSPLLLARAPGLQQLELLVYDWYYHMLPARRPDPRIVIVRINEASLAHLPSTVGARIMQARVVDNLRQAGAKVIGFDETFSSALPAQDKLFAGALARQGHVIVALESQQNAIDAPLTLTPVAPLLRPVVVAAVQLLPRRLGKVRRFMPYVLDTNTHRQYPHIALALAAIYQDKIDWLTPRQEQRQAERAGMALDPMDGVLIRYAVPVGRFATVPYEQVYNGTWAAAYGPGFFRGKLVLLSSPAAQQEIVDTPSGEMPSDEVLANATQTVLQGARLRHWSWATSYLMTVVVCLLLALAIWQMGLQGGLYVITAEAMLWLIVAQQLLFRTGLWIDTVQPLAVLGVTFLLATATEIHRMRRVFQRFMPSWVAHEMMDANANAALQTVEQEAAVIFCDVRNYTALSEMLPGEVMEELLHRYFDAAEQAAHRWGTEIDKFVGDEIMLYYIERRKKLRPTDESVSLRAVRWALAMQAATEAINASGIAGNIGFQVGIGICTGIIRIGTIGSQQRIQHTLIGDAVNTASRLQGLTKELGCSIVISQSTYEQAAEYLEVRAIGEVVVKGKQKPIPVFCPLQVIEKQVAKS